MRLGESDLATAIDCEGDYLDCADPAQDISIANITIHEGFKYNAFNVPENDIALIRLARSVRFSEFILPICLPLAGRQHKNIQPKDRSEVTGWNRYKGICFDRCRHIRSSRKYEQIFISSSIQQQKIGI